MNLLEEISGQKLTLASFIRSIREGEEWSQVTLSEKLGVSRQYICDLEHNRRSVSPEMASKFAKDLGYSEEQFIRLSIQDSLDKIGLPFNVDVKRAA
jgi:transcriptional regulator with XRE-family HTH domain